MSADKTHSVPSDQGSRLLRAHHALVGLSVGDAFGECFFRPSAAEWAQEGRTPPPPWRYTDDTEMALAGFDVLDRHQTIDQDALALAFARRYAADPERGYGGTAHSILRAIGSGIPWQQASRACFDGAGSMGNGAAMRVAPIGAYFADDLALVCEQARRSAEVTHAHPDGQAGAIAVAVAAAYGARAPFTAADEFFTAVLDLTPVGDTRSGIERARSLALSYDVRTAVSALGNGSHVVSSDTIPLCMWIVARHPTDYFSALWTAVAAGGDRDTTSAIIGGILASWHGERTVPDWWLPSRDPLMHDVDLQRDTSVD
ncbi:MAG: ADP-ribosylglycohydrolase family protein [Planctomycetes bacterium]|nr:ADP-ribosylglycohydrolase family protein [Planctomycetota bacterium]